MYIRHCNFYQWETYLFGKFNTIFSCEEDNISNSILKLLDTYLAIEIGSPREKLEMIIADKLNNMIIRDWRYYFLKYYDKMLMYGSYFAKENDFEIECLGSESSNPLVAYHINPYINTVSLLMDDHTIATKMHWGIYSYVSTLKINNGIELYSKKDGWYLNIPENQTISEDLRKKYNINEKKFFLETKEEDRIEIAIKFCKDLI